MYLGDLRRFIEVKEETNKEGVIRSINDLTVDFQGLSQVITELKDDGYIEKVIGWVHPTQNETQKENKQKENQVKTKNSRLINMPEYDPVNLWGADTRERIKLKIFSFHLRGKMAHFRKYYSNSSALSYFIPPRTTVVGILAGLLGRERDTYYNEFSLKKCNIALAIQSPIKNPYKN